MKTTLLVFAFLLIAQSAFASVKHYSDGSKEITSGNSTHYYDSDGSYEKSSYES